MKVVSNALWNASRSMVGLALGLVTSIVIARTLGPDRYGEYSYLNWLTMTLTALTGLGFPMALMKLVSEARGGSNPAPVQDLLGVALRRAGTASAAALLLALAIALVFPIPFTALHFVLAALATVPSVLAACYGAVINGLEAYKPTTRVSIVVATLQFGLTLTVLSLGGGIGALLGVGLVGAVASMVWLRMITERLADSRSSPAPQDARAGMARYAREMILIILLDVIVWKRSELFFLERFWGMRTVGLYSVAFGIAEKAMKLPHSLYGTLFPTFSNLSAARDSAGVERLMCASTRLVSVIVMPIGLTLAVVAGPLVESLYGAEYAPAAGALAVVTLVNILGAATGVAVMTLYGIGEQRLVLMKDGAGAVVNLALNLTLTTRYGLWGAVLANSAAQMVSCAIVWHYIHRRFDLTPLRGPLAQLFALSVVGAAMARFVVNAAPGAAGLIAGIVLASAVLAGGLFLTGVVGRKDWRALRVESA
jgi:O-antigen/teichoic acid export membrane protein